MKKLLFASLVLVVYLEACDSANPEVSKEGEVSFSFYPMNEGGRQSSESEIALVYFELNSANGNEIEMLPVFTYNDQYVTPSFYLPTGSYSLEKFVVLDTGKNVLYGVPLAGSEEATFVNNPLPLSFSVSSDEENELALQVIKATGLSPGAFGLSTFRIKPVCIREIPINVTTMSEVSTGSVNAVLKVDAFDTLYPGEVWTKTYEFTSPASLKIPVGYNQYKFTMESEGMLPQTMHFRTDFYDGNLEEYESIDFELIPENSPNVEILEYDGFRFFVSTDPCKLWARMEAPDEVVFSLDYVRYWELGVDAEDKYVGQLYPGGALIGPKITFVNFNNLFSDYGSYFNAENYCEKYLNVEYRDKLDEVTLEKALILDFDYTGDESKLEDFDVHLIKVY